MEQRGTQGQYEQSTARTVAQSVWSVARVIIIFICSLMIVVGIGLYVYQYVQSNYLTPPGIEGAPAQEIIVPKGMSINQLSLLLESKKLVRDAKVFKYLVDFSGYDNKIQAGHYILDGSMTMQQIMEKLAQGQNAAPVTTFTIMEGSTVEQVAAQLQKQGILTDTAKFLSLCKTGDKFTNYPFVKQAIATKNSSQRFYMLEGYLFPAKYEIYLGTSEEDIIKKMLDKTNSVMTNAYIARAGELGLTYDQVLSLASMIEKEGTPDTFAKISAVFHNRLDAKIALGSDVTVAYAAHVTGFNIDQYVGIDSPYNTRKYKGLPLGPIGNPSEAAIKAALYPDQDYVNGKYLYFYLTDPNKGTVEFYKTIDEFNAGKAKAKPVWDAYNKAHGIS